MTMQCRHFELIAETLSASCHNAGLLQSDRESIARDFADKLASTNPNFNRARFLRACGVES